METLCTSLATLPVPVTGSDARDPSHFRYATLCKVGTGLKMQDYDWMK
jgi:hypothetical protein